MKSIATFFILLTLFSSLSISAQEYDSDFEPELDEESMSEEGQISPESASSEYEQQQEDLLHPEGETNDWSLGSEDLAAEEYE